MRREAAMSLEQKRILVVEDEFLLARDLTKALEEAGATVIGPVPSVERAMARLRHDPLDAAVLDIAVRGEDVLPLADVLKDRAVPIIFATGNEDHRVRHSHADAPCLTKPIDMEMLVRVVDEQIARA